MSRWHGKIGFYVTDEVRPGVYKPQIIEKEYEGTVENIRRMMTEVSTTPNDDIRITSTISVIADPYINSNFLSIKYVEFMGTKIRVSDVSVAPPRLNLTLGGVYNE